MMQPITWNDQGWLQEQQISVGFCSGHGNPTETVSSDCLGWWRSDMLGMLCGLLACDWLLEAVSLLVSVSMFTRAQCRWMQMGLVLMEWVAGTR